jgi:hypothetical protein
MIILSRSLGSYAALYAMLVLRSPARRDVGGCALRFVALRSVRDRSSNHAPGVMLLKRFSLGSLGAVGKVGPRAC